MWLSEKMSENIETGKLGNEPERLRTEDCNTNDFLFFDHEEED